MYLWLLFQLDVDKPLEDQGPFDLILHKLRDAIVEVQHDMCSSVEQRLVTLLEVCTVIESYSNFAWCFAD